MRASRPATAPALLPPAPPPRYRSRAQRAAIALLRAADDLHRELAALLEPHGLTPQQFNVLRILRGAGPEGLPTLAIGERMIEQAPGVTRLLDRLEAKRWVARERCPADRRRVVCRITSAGRELLAGLDGPVAQFDDNSLAALTARDQASLILMLETLHAARVGGARSRPSAGPTAGSRPQRRHAS